ncbi:MAG: family 16 glycoside hydrolase [Bacteroidota bacterium]
MKGKEFLKGKISPRVALLSLSVALCLLQSELTAQIDEMVSMPYSDMSAFKTQAGNWSIVGGVSVNPTIDIHAQEESTNSNKKRKKKRKKNRQAPLKGLTYTEGQGILLNYNDEVKKSHLLTTWEHGDLLFETDVLLPKGSNSGIYLQGSYEVQLFDSWGVKSPKYSDIGGIYRNWEKVPEKIYMGKAPFTNAAFAPGVWQHLKIAFQAPRFDANGQKVANAKFVYVDLNGVRIHENVEVPLLTGGPIAKNEVARGPLMIQGDHGPVAFKNTKYQLLEDSAVSLVDMNYKVYHGIFDKGEDCSGVPVKFEGTLPKLTHTVAQKSDQFAVAVKGKLKVTKTGAYRLRLDHLGGLQFKVNGATVLNEQTPSSYGQNTITLTLDQGETPFELLYYKKIGWRPPLLGIFDVNSFPRPLHDFSSNASAAPSSSPIYIEPEGTPRLLRAFYDFEGDRARRLTHSIGVGSPEGTHYIYDLKRASVACVWRGPFVDATPMWNDRGDGSFRPRGATRTLFEGMTLTKMTDIPQTTFPKDPLLLEGFKNKGYEIDQETGYPIFLYQVGDLQLKDAVYPVDNGRSLRRTMQVAQGNTAATGLWMKLAEAETITQLATGEYAVGQRFYIDLDGGNTAIIRQVQGKQELIAPLNGGAVGYTIIW